MMDKSRLNEIKNRIYEAEGLLELMQLRDDKDAELAPMVLARLEESCRLMSELTEKVSAVPYTDEPDDVKPDDVKPDTVEPDADEPMYMVVEDDAAEVSSQAADTDTEADVEPEPDTEITEISERQEEHDRANPAFCLNDRFRFRRTLFGGSDAEFNAVMDHVATLSGFDEAEDYFYGDRGLDPEDPDVTDFMEIIRNYFA